MDEGFQMASFSCASTVTDFGDYEYGTDLSSSIIFSADFQKFDDLKNLLECSKDAMKLDAMRRIIGMVARGKDCSELFPSVVKNVVSKNAEDPNQMARASALRVFTSLRVPMLIPVVMLAVQDASKDVSPYVRKAAAHGILKIFSLEPEEKDSLVVIISRLLSDRSTLVIGTAVYAFEQVCPERLDLIHQNFKKLCNILIDVDEWGQIVIINMLLRYARTQFPDPTRSLRLLLDPLQLEPSQSHELDGGMPSDSSWLDEDLEVAANGDNGTLVSDAENELSNGAKPLTTNALLLLKADYMNLVNACLYLLHSRNVGVVVAVSRLVVELSYLVGFQAVARALVRSMHNTREVQYTVLHTIASLTIEHRSLFEPYLRSFFVYSNDSTPVKLLKLEVLCNLATETTSPSILREFQHYINSSDGEFATATIQAIGRCASAVPQIADICLTGLVRLISSTDAKLVAECVVVLRKLLQIQRCSHKGVLKHIAQLTDTMKVPSALASILWLLGEYSHRVPQIAPDVLRNLAKVFPDQEVVVKLQPVALDTMSGETVDEPLQGFGDRTGRHPYLVKHARRILLAPKPAPLLHFLSPAANPIQLPGGLRWGSLSHVLHRRLPGYQDLSGWPSVPPNAWSRQVQAPTTTRSPSLQASNGQLSSSFGAPGGRSSGGQQNKSIADFFSDQEDVICGDQEGDAVSEEQESEGKQCDEESLSGNEYLYEDEEEEDVSSDEPCPSGDPEPDLFTQFYSADEQMRSTRVRPASTANGSPPAPSSSSPSGTTEPSDSEEDTFSSGRVTCLPAVPGQPGGAGSGCQRAGVQPANGSGPVTVNTNKVYPLDTSNDQHNETAAISSSEGDTYIMDSVSGVSTDEVTGTSSISLPTALVALQPSASRDSSLVTCLTPVDPPSCRLSATTTDDSISPTESVTLAPSLYLDSLTTSPTPLPTVATPAVDQSSMFLAESLPAGGLQSELDVIFPMAPTCWETVGPTGFESVPSNPLSPWLHLQYRFLRTPAATAVATTGLQLAFTSDRDDLAGEVRDLRMDLTRTLCTRVLSAANRIIQPGPPIATLEAGGAAEMLVSVDLTGFVDPIEVEFVYTVVAAPGPSIRPDLPTDPLRWTVVIEPPVGELMWAYHLDVAEYTRLRDQLVTDEQFDQLQLAPGSFDAALLEEPAEVVGLLLSCCHSDFLFAYWLRPVCPSSSPKAPRDGLQARPAPWDATGGDLPRRLSLFFSARTIAGNQACLVEVSWQCATASATRTTLGAPATSSLLLTVLCPSASFRGHLLQHISSVISLTSA